MTGAEYSLNPDLPFADSLSVPGISAIILKDDGTIPNNGELPLVVYRGALKRSVLARLSEQLIQEIFHAHGWRGSWVNGIFGYHHYHSTAHEVLGCFSGSVTVQFGGPKGIKEKLEAGDVVVIPAGVGHKNCGSTADFGVVGAYPPGQSWDLLTGEPGERPEADRNIARVPLPATDPVYGRDGPLVTHWAK